MRVNRYLVDIAIHKFEMNASSAIMQHAPLRCSCSGSLTRRPLSLRYLLTDMLRAQHLASQICRIQLHSTARRQRQWDFGQNAQGNLEHSRRLKAISNNERVHSLLPTIAPFFGTTHNHIQPSGHAMGLALKAIWPFAQS